MKEFEKLDYGLYVFRRDQKNLVINPKCFKWAVVSERGYNSLISYLNGRGDYDLEIINQFKLDKIIGNDSYSILLEKRIRKRDLSIVVLHTTDRCSLDCNYCYANANSSEKDMSLKISKKTIDRVIENNPSRPITIEFHGGEPTLKQDLIKSTVEYAEKFKIKNVPIFRYSIQTNAVNIPNSFLKFLKDKYFSVGISLDGPKKFHDKNRVYSSGKGSFEDVIKTISKMHELKLDFSTICVVNDPKVLSYYPQFMINNKIGRVKFNPYFEGQGRAINPEMNIKKQKKFTIMTETEFITKVRIN